MISVKVKGVAHLGKLIGPRGEMNISLPSGSSLYELFKILIERCGQPLKEKLFEEEGPHLRKDLRILLNGRDITFLEGLDTKLQEGDLLSLIPPLAGG